MASTINWNNLDKLESFKKLLSLKNSVSVAKELQGENGAVRVSKYSVPMGGGLTYNYAAKQVNEQLLSVFQQIADEDQLLEKFRALYNGEVVNLGEKRMVLHQLTRGQLGEAVNADGTDKRDFYETQRKNIAAFADKVHSGKSLTKRRKIHNSMPDRNRRK